MKIYTTEREGQIDFFKNFHIDYEHYPILIDYTDGVWNGCLFEFKLVIDNPNKVLFQAIKYLSKMRIKGESVPATIILVSLNTSDCYIYKSEDYYEQIHQIYFGGSSLNNEKFIAKAYKQKLNLNREMDVTQLFLLIKGKKEITEKYIPIEINEDCIVGWAERFYRENPNAKKGDFIGSNEGIIPINGEIREPKIFKYLIKPYTAKSNQRFKYLMDKLNDKQKKKDLGAFYTPVLYCEKAIELVREAIRKVPKDNDYIILDRCAGTGNLEAFLTEEELSHCILSTYEYYEYKVLLERLGDKVRAIIPPTENNVNYSSGYILNANALDKYYIDNELIKKYVDNPRCTIILYENPPYRDITAQDKVETKEKNYVYKEFIKNGTNQAAHREIDNLFIWSAFKYYLRQTTDSYIVFSPVKYFKSLNLVNKKFIKGFAFNRKHFHSSPSVISCIYWQNIDDEQTNEYILSAYDIVNNKITYIKDISIKKTYKTFVEYNDKEKYKDDIESNIYCENTTGLQSHKPIGNKKAVYNKNIVGYLRATSFNLNANSRCLTRTITHDALTQSYGFYLRKENYIKKLPLFAAKLYPQNNWYEKDIFFTTSDSGDKYINDIELLKKCLIYVSLSSQNKCRSFESTNGIIFKNEICLDKNTCAFSDLQKYKLDNDDKELINLYKIILLNIRNIPTYNRNFTYGIYQIDNDFNTYSLDENGNKIYDYPILNGNLKTLQAKLKDYYEKYIICKLFKYELLK